MKHLGSRKGPKDTAGAKAAHGMITLRKPFPALHGGLHSLFVRFLLSFLLCSFPLPVYVVVCECGFINASMLYQSINLSSCPSTIGNLSTLLTYNLICSKSTFSGARQHALPVASRCDCA